MANTLELILKARDEATAQLKAAAQQMGGLTDKIREHQKALITMTVAGAAAGAGLGLLIKSAADEEAGIVRLSVALRNVGISYDQVKGSLESVILATQRKTGIADDQQREALGRVLYVTQDYNLALSALPAILDLATARGMDLAQAGELVGRALTGSTEMLRRYGIEIAEGASATEVLAELTKRFGGTAEAMGDTTAGAFNKLKAAIGDTMETFGTLLLPIVEKAAAALQNLAQWVEKIPDPLKKIGLALMGAAVVGGVVAGFALLAEKIIAATTAIKAMTLALPLLHGALLGPLGLLAAGIGVGAIYGISQLMKGIGQAELPEDVKKQWVEGAKLRKFGFFGEIKPMGAIEKSGMESFRGFLKNLIPMSLEERQKRREEESLKLFGPDPFKALGVSFKDLLAMPFEERLKKLGEFKPLPPEELVHPLREMYEKQAQESIDLAKATERSWLDSLKEIGDKALAEIADKELADLEFSKDSRKALLDYEIEQANILRDTQLAGVRAWIDELTAGANLENDNRRAEHKADMDLIEEKRRKELELIDLYASIWRGTTGIAWTPPVPPPVGGFRPLELKDTTGWVPLPGQKIEVDIRFRGGMADLFEVAGYAVNTQARVPAE